MAKALVYGDNVNTDLIIPGKYTKTLDMQELARHCMEDLDLEFAQKLAPGDIVVAGSNFGCGSSREQAPLALKAAGVQALLVQSSARIFYRNAINVGLPILICNTGGIQDGDQIEVDISSGLITVNGIETLHSQPLPPIMRSILAEGGLVPFLKVKGKFEL